VSALCNKIVGTRWPARCAVLPASLDLEPASYCVLSIADFFTSAAAAAAAAAAWLLFDLLLLTALRLLVLLESRTTLDIQDVEKEAHNKTIQASEEEGTFCCSPLLDCLNPD
jgi:hypothetical protein